MFENELVSDSCY